MKRELGITERALVIADQYAPFHSVYVLCLESPPLPQYLREALKSLQKRHPILHARVLEEQGKYYYASLVEPILVYRVLPRWNDTHWVKVVEVELEAHPERTDDPLFRCTYLYNPDQKHAEIILTFFHAVVDDASAGCLMDELLTACASFMEGEVVTVSELVPASAQESRFPSPFRGFPLGVRKLGYLARQSVDELLYRIQSRQKRVPPVQKNASHGHIISLTLPEAWVATLNHRANLERIMLPSVLHAALLIAVNRHFYAGNNVPMRELSLWDMRSDLEPPLSNGEPGRFTSFLRHTVPVEGGGKVWQLARSLQQKLYLSLKRGDHFVSATLIESLLKGVIHRRSARLASTGLNFVGNSKLKLEYGEMIVHDLHGFVSAFALGPEFSGQARFFRGQLIWDFTYLEADMSLEEARAIVEEIKSILNSAVTIPLIHS